MPPRTHHAGKRAPGCAAKPEAGAARNDQITEDTEHAAEPEQPTASCQPRAASHGLGARPHTRYAR